jgi:hypothetical protein
VPATPRFPDEMLVRDARDEFFRINKLGPDGGLSDRWVKIEAPFPFYIPNIPARRRAVVLHDIHHIAAPFDTSWAGEAEIGAWEIAGAWTLNLAAFFWGLFIAPRKLFRAFCRGRRSHNLYHQGYADSVLAESMGTLRERLKTVAPLDKPTPADIAGFSLWTILAVIASVGPPAAMIAGLLWIIR